MLIQFSVENYRSIKKEQTLSLVRSTSDEMADNYFAANAPATPDLLKSAVIYGANASGKSNVIKALDSMISIIADSFNKKPDYSIGTTPFLFDSDSQKQPTIYDISLVVDLVNEQGDLQKTRVDYGFVVDQDRVYEEWLSVYPKGREQNWFSREYNEEISDYEWKMSDYFKGEKSSWRNQTRADQLFLSTAVHLNSEQIKPIYRALTERIPIIRTDRISDKMAKEFCKKSEKDKSIIIALLRSAGIELNDIVFEKPKLNLAGIPENLPTVIRNQLMHDIQKDFVSQYETFFVYYDNEGNEQKINLREESDGTQKLFEFAGLILVVLKNGDTLVIDELNKSLHPDLVRFLVKLFNSPVNQNNAQLIFTTHETSVLRKNLLRRDQVWFCEKDNNRATNLYPLTDFRPHKNREDIEEYYLHGKYGAKPIIQEFTPPEFFWEE
ncbi:phage resistance protein [Moraxella caviae]|uniref:Phage resistance protein n=1 Tax=Moraxella caviae TaxID=34060 RepID=A0A1T0A1A3_9GAMM|nr:ATP-binding protein [Moraxella caviae]OOR89467.1 phage resistance protein [Moraxella caviae]STZ09805.1 Predicted ATPase [Moraxella caviae]